METKKDPTCEELVEGKLKGRLDALLPDLDEPEMEALIELSDYHGIELPDREDYDEDEDGQEYFVEACRIAVGEGVSDKASEMVLGIDVEIVKKVTLSCGGPADWFELISDGEDWIDGAYVYQDWYDVARRTIPMDTVEELAALWCLEP